MLFARGSGIPAGLGQEMRWAGRNENLADTTQGIESRMAK